MTSIVIEEKKSNTDWTVEEYGNTFLESYDSFSSSQKISDQDHGHEGSDQMKSIEKLSTEEREKTTDDLENMISI